MFKDYLLKKLINDIIDDLYLKFSESDKEKIKKLVLEYFEKNEIVFIS